MELFPYGGSRLRLNPPHARRTAPPRHDRLSLAITVAERFESAPGSIRHQERGADLAAVAHQHVERAAGGTGVHPLGVNAGSRQVLA